MSESTPTPTSLADFLRRVAADPGLLASLKDPEADRATILASNGLSAEDQDVLLHGSREDVIRALGQDPLSDIEARFWWFF